MDTVMFGGVGLVFILFGLFLVKKHRHFISHCIKVDGRVVDIVDKVYTTRNGFGQVTEQNTVRVPIVQYQYNKLYQFQAEIDVRTHGLTHDSMVAVLINPLLPKTAKLAIGAKQNTMVFYLMIGLGVFSLMIGVTLFNPGEFNFDFLLDPLTLVIVFIILIFLYFKFWPMLRYFPNMPIYTENAVEVNNDDSA